MSDRDDFRQFLEDESIGSVQSFLENEPMEPVKQFTEIPPPLPPMIRQAPSGYDPMTRIELEGEAYRGLASGQVAWWLIVTGWIMFGVPCLMMIVMAVALGDPWMLVTLVLPAMGLWIMWQGTRAKLTRQKARRQRQAKYWQGMSH